MRVPPLVLALGAALVAAGGLYLWQQVRTSGASSPSPKAIADAKAHADPLARTAATGTGGDRRPSHLDDDESAATDAGVRLPTRPHLAHGLDTAARDGAAVPDHLGDDPRPPDPVELDQKMLEANKAYDRHAYDEARVMAIKLLEASPGNVRMLRVVVSSSCIMGDAEEAQKYWGQLPQFDRDQMTERCSKFGVAFTAP